MQHYSHLLVGFGLGYITMTLGTFGLVIYLLSFYTLYLSLLPLLVCVSCPAIFIPSCISTLSVSQSLVFLANWVDLVSGVYTRVGMYWLRRNERIYMVST